MLFAELPKIAKLHVAVEACTLCAPAADSLWRQHADMIYNLLHIDLLLGILQGQKPRCKDASQLQLLLCEG